MATFTFAENLTDWPEARRRWDNFLKKLDRSQTAPLELCWVAEVQARGAWHFHCIVNHWIQVEVARPIAVSCGLGKVMFFREIEGGAAPPGVRSPTGPSRAIRYVAKYITKDVGSGRAHVGYFGGRHVKRGTTRFRWNTILYKLYRRGMGYFRTMARGENDPDWLPHFWMTWDTAMRQGVRLLTPEERSAMALASDWFAKFLVDVERPPHPQAHTREERLTTPAPAGLRPTSQESA